MESVKAAPILTPSTVTCVLLLIAFLLLAVAPDPAIRGASQLARPMESVKAAPILMPSTVTVDGGAAATTTEDEENAAAAADAIAEMAKHLTIGTDDNANTSEPVDLGAEGDVYSCKDCRTHLGLAADIISKGFHCKNGKAYLFDKVANVNVGAKEDSMMITGMHTISNIFCVGCGAIVGWKYEAAHERAQRYKEGKFILERYMLVGPDNGMDNSASSDLVCPVESGLEAARILTPSAVSVDGEAAATATEDEENASAAADAIAEMAKHLTIGTDDNANTSGPVDLVAAEGDEVYSCKDCRTHLGLATDIISKGFHSKNGKAYLFDKVVNVNVGPKEDRMMVTGMHTISDIFCAGCGAIVGWKYEAAHERSQRYKEGKFILERYMLVGPDGSPYSDCK